MNIRLEMLAVGCFIVGLTTSGCSGPAKQQDALFRGGSSALTSATQDTIDASDTSRGSALGSMRPRQRLSASERLLSPFKSVERAFAGNSSNESISDPLSLSNPSDNPGSELFVTAARVVAGGGNYENAKSLFEQALIANPDDRETLLELARLEIAHGRTNEATTYYQRAVDAHPNDPVVFNDLGLFHADQQNWDLAERSFARATELDGNRKLYRNNFADVLIKMGRPDRALTELMAVHPKPVAHYNLGYLLYRHQMILPAVEQFEMAYESDRQFIDAFMMRNRLLQELQNSMPAMSSADGAFVRPASFEDGAPGIVERATMVTDVHDHQTHPIASAFAGASENAESSRATESREDSVNQPEAHQPNIIILTPEEAASTEGFSARLSDSSDSVAEQVSPTELAEQESTADTSTEEPLMLDIPSNVNPIASSHDPANPRDETIESSSRDAHRSNQPFWSSLAQFAPQNQAGEQLDSDATESNNETVNLDMRSRDLSPEASTEAIPDFSYPNTGVPAIVPKSDSTGATNTSRTLSQPEQYLSRQSR